MRRPQRKTSARGYGAAHQREREKYRDAVDAGREHCRRCRLKIPPGGHGPCPRCGTNHHGWDLGHLDGSNKTIWTGPEHVCCNRAAGGRVAAHNRRITRRVQGLLRRTSREW